ncbi:hypothetical protein LshimejAT787_0201400 [Lyophyllum shimeji]|uniref:Uncharacterized protein n=1 Tax=Lyophyllum shimeji TaxID=47721 RepID=A0A9P3PEP7_LYOSH|nr:hypothetical protein LshimejAT787_0201400 [Lyophyllum shimeji]
MADGSGWTAISNGAGPAFGEFVPYEWEVPSNRLEHRSEVRTSQASTPRLRDDDDEPSAERDRARLSKLQPHSEKNPSHVSIRSSHWSNHRSAAISAHTARYEGTNVLHIHSA